MQERAESHGLSLLPDKSPAGQRGVMGHGGGIMNQGGVEHGGGMSSGRGGSQ